MNESILNSIKKMLGITEDYTHFDEDIIMHINSVFMILNQLGVGPEKSYSISDNTATWSDFIPDTQDVQAVKTYIYLKTRLMFDPPVTTNVLNAIKDNISELEFRLNVQVDPSIGGD